MENIYVLAMEAVSVLLCFMGGYLIFGKLPVWLRSSAYRSARRVAGSIYVICALHIAASLLFDLRLLGSSFAPAVCISTYYLMSLMFAWSFTRLVGDRKYFRGWRIYSYFAVWALYTATLFGLLALLDGEASRICLMVAAAIYVVLVAVIVKLFFRAYRAALLKAENYYSESVEVIITWVSKSVKNLVVLGFLGGLIAFSPPICIVIYGVYALGLMIYIFSNFITMMINIPELMVRGVIAVEGLVFEDERGDGESLNDEILSTEVSVMIEEKLSQWIKDKGYLVAGVSVISMAGELFTNRTYLSRYVNMRYGMSFREWVLSLRIEEAKKMLLESEERLQVSQIAHRVGFASPASFTRAFSRNEGVTPLKWREIYSKKNR